MTDVTTGSTVLVSNLSTQVTEESLQEFFGFCGEIVGIKLVTYQSEEDAFEPTQRAFITFAREAATKTALLLNHASIYNRPVHVSSLKQATQGSVSSLAPSATPSPRESATPPGEAPAEPAKAASSSSVDAATPAPPEDDEFAYPIELVQEDKPKLVIVEEIIEKGYKLTEEIIANARQFDETYGISERFRQFVEQGVATGNELNERYKITEKGQALVENVRQGAASIYTQVDSQFHVNDHIQRVSASAKATVNNLDQRYNISGKLQGFLNLNSPSSSTPASPTLAPVQVDAATSTAGEAVPSAAPVEGSPAAATASTAA